MAEREFRVVWQREGRVQQVKRYARRKNAEMRYDLLTSDEPWTVLGYEATDYVCCGGHECGCGGETFQRKTERIQSETPLKYARIESRKIGDWKPEISTQATVSASALSTTVESPC